MKSLQFWLNYVDFRAFSGTWARLWCARAAGFSGVLFASAAVAQAGTQAGAIAYFDAAFNGDCRPYAETVGLLEDEGGPMPRRYEFTYQASWASAGDPPEQAVLFEFFCDAGAYNVRTVFLRDRGDYFEPVSFARPSVAVENETEDYDSPVRSVTVTGYGASLSVTNGRFDPDTRRLTAHAYWRGLGDAYDEAVWIFRDDGFVLERFEVDADYDGEVDPQLRLDFSGREPGAAPN